MSDECTCIRTASLLSLCESCRKKAWARVMEAPRAAVDLRAELAAAEARAAEYVREVERREEIIHGLDADLAAAVARAETAERMHDELLGVTELLAAERAKSKALADRVGQLKELVRENRKECIALSETNAALAEAMERIEAQTRPDVESTRDTVNAIARAALANARNTEPVRTVRTDLALTRESGADDPAEKLCPKCGKTWGSHGWLGLKRCDAPRADTTEGEK